MATLAELMSQHRDERRTPSVASGYSLGDLMQQYTRNVSGLSDLNASNYMQKASERVIKAQRERREAGSKPLTSSEQMAMVDAMREMAGVQPKGYVRTETGAVPIDPFRVTQYQQRMRGGSGLTNFLARQSAASLVPGGAQAVSRVAGQATDATAGVLAKLGADSVKLLNPEYGAQLEYNADVQYGPALPTLAAGAGRMAGEVIKSIPVMVGPGAAAHGLLGASLMYGVPSAGAVRGNIAEARARGADIPLYQEIGAAAGEFGIQTGFNMLKVRLAKASAGPVGAITKTLRAQAGKLGVQGVKRAIAGAMPKIIPQALRFEVMALGEGAEEATQSLMSSWIESMVWNPDLTMDQALDQSWEESKAGFGLAHVLGPLAKVLGSGGTNIDVASTETAPAGTPGKLAPGQLTFDQQTDVLKGFMDDPRIARELKDTVVARVTQADQRGEPYNPVAIIEEAARVAGDDAPDAVKQARELVDRESVRQASEAGDAPTQIDMADSGPGTAVEMAPLIHADTPVQTSGGAVAPEGTQETFEEYAARVATSASDSGANVQPEERKTPRKRAQKEPGPAPVAQPAPEQVAPPGVLEAQQVETQQAEAQQATEAALQAQIDQSSAEQASIEQTIAEAQAVSEQAQKPREPKAKKRAEGDPVPTIEAGQELGLTYDGMMEDRVQFTDPDTGTTFLVKPGDDVGKKLADTRERFVKGAEDQAKREAEPKAEPEAEPEGGVRMTEKQEKQATREREKKAEEAKAKRRGPQDQPEVEEETASLYEAALTGRISEAQKAKLGDPKDLLAKVAESGGSDTDAVTRYIATQIGLINKVAGKMLGPAADVSKEDLVQEGVTELHRLLTKPITKGPNKGKSHAEVVLEKGISPTTYFFGAMSGRVALVMRRAAFPTRGRERGAALAKPDRSFDELSEAGLKKVEAATKEGQVAARAAIDPEPDQEGKPVPAELIAKYSETVQKMKADGATDTEILDWLHEQGDVRFTPSMALYMLEAASLDAKPVGPKTDADREMARIAKERGITLVFFRRQAAPKPGEARGMAAGGLIAMEAGQTSDTAWEVFFHEAAHDINMDTLKIRDKKAIKRAEAEYLSQTTEEHAEWLREHPKKLRREATAMLIGEAARSAKVRARLNMENPSLLRQMWESMRATLKRWAGRSSYVDEIIAQWDWNGTGVQEGGVTTSGIMFSPKPYDPLGADIKSFLDEIAKVSKEAPKVTGRPELANPMDTAPTRSMQDIIDERMKLSGEPQKQTEAQWRRGAKAILADPTKKAELRARLEGEGVPASPAEEVAGQIMAEEIAQQIWAKGEAATVAEVKDLQDFASGRRRGRSELARIMRAGVDRHQTPKDRLRGYINDSMANRPPHVQVQIEAAEVKGDKAKADKLANEWAERWHAVILELEAKGLNPENMTDAEAGNERTHWRVVRTVERATRPQGFWGVINEWRRNMLMYAPLTLFRNMLGGPYAVADVFITKPIARVINSAVTGRDISGETGAAWHAISSKVVWGKALRNLVNTFIFEVPTFDLGVEAKTSVEAAGARQTEIYTPPSITGESVGKLAGRALGTDGGKVVGNLTNMLGHLVRAPQRINAAVDQLVKTLHAHAEVAAYAIEIGKAQGLQVGSAEMQAFVDEQLDNMGSPSWSGAMATGETSRVTFQAKARAVEQAMLDLRKNFPILGTLIPFIKSPIQLAGQALVHVPGVGALEMARKAVRTRQGKETYSGKEWSRHAAQQIIGIAGLALIWRWLDDDEPKITGPASYARQDRPERVTTQQVRPYNSIKIGDKWYSYKNIEPYSQWIGTIVALGEEIRRNNRANEKPSATARRLWSRIEGMYSDQTYIRQLGDIDKMLRDPSSYSGEQAMVNFAGSWLPNIIDSAMRAEDPFVRERMVMGEEGERPTIGKRILREMWPSSDVLPPPKVDWLGEEIRIPGHQAPSTMFATRLLSPVTERRTLQGTRGEVIDMLMEYNKDKRAEDQQWFQSPARKVTIRIPNKLKPVQQDMNEVEYNLYARLAGLMAAKIIARQSWNTKAPTKIDVLKLEKIFTQSRSAARKYVQAARQQKALGRDAQYKKTIDELRKRIEQEQP